MDTRKSWLERLDKNERNEDVDLDRKIKKRGRAAQHLSPDSDGGSETREVFAVKKDASKVLPLHPLDDYLVEDV